MAEETEAVEVSESPPAAVEREKSRNRKADGNYPVHLTPEQIMIVRRVIDHRWGFDKKFPPIIDPKSKKTKEEQEAEHKADLEKLLHVCDIFYHAYEQYCP